MPGTGEWPICANGSILWAYGKSRLWSTRSRVQVMKRPFGCRRDGSSHSSLTVTVGLPVTMPISRRIWVLSASWLSTSLAGSSWP